DNAIVDEDDNGDSHNIKNIKSRGKATFHMGDEEEEEEEEEEEDDEEGIEDETTLKAVNSNMSGGAGTSNVIAGPAFNTG
ncbi:hypothetical protein CANINC_001019, partial [Pichia inconspicua]